MDLSTIDALLNAEIFNGNAQFPLFKATGMSGVIETDGLQAIPIDLH
jgi:hypothetical protein